MPNASLTWKAVNNAFSAQIANVTYRVAFGVYGHSAYFEVHSPPRDLKRLDLGLYIKLEQAKQACERHYAARLRMSKAKQFTH